MAVGDRNGARPSPGRKKGLLIVPEFPYDSFWSYRYVVRHTIPARRKIGSRGPDG